MKDVGENFDDLKLNFQPGDANSTQEKYLNIKHFKNKKRVNWG